MATATIIIIIIAAVVTLAAAVTTFVTTMAKAKGKDTNRSEVLEGILIELKKLNGKIEEGSIEAREIFESEVKNLAQVYAEEKHMLETFREWSEQGANFDVSKISEEIKQRIRALALEQAEKEVIMSKIVLEAWLKKEHDSMKPNSGTYHDYSGLVKSSRGIYKEAQERLEALIASIGDDSPTVTAASTSDQ